LNATLNKNTFISPGSVETYVRRGGIVSDTLFHFSEGVPVLELLKSGRYGLEYDCGFFDSQCIIMTKLRDIL